MPNALSRTQRVVLLCVLVFGVLVMHHAGPAGVMHRAAETVAIEAPMTAVTLDAAPQHPACPQCGDHDAVHVCLAVLCETTTILLDLLAPLGVAHEAAATTAPRGSPRRDDSSGTGGRAVLTCLCVLRV
jgi:Family of unknown function (DUF6153)